MTSDKTEFFGKEHAVNYDKNSEGLAAIKDALHLVTNITLMDLPGDSNILCVGAGTGAELIALAQNNPGWTFTALDPSEAMLDVCREKLDKAGFLSRCEFHHGYTDSLPKNKTYDAATAILVSQFLTKKEDRIAFFQTIKQHLSTGGYLINADLARPDNQDCYRELMAYWIKMHRYNGLSNDRAEASTSQWGKHVSVSTRDEIEKFLSAGGFVHCTLAFQVLCVHAWVSRVAS